MNRFYFATEAEKTATIELLKILRASKRRMEMSRKAGVDTIHGNLAAALRQAIAPMRKVVDGYRSEFLYAVERKVYQATTSCSMALTYTQLLAEAEKAQVA